MPQYNVCTEAFVTLHVVFMRHCTFLLYAMSFLTWKLFYGSYTEFCKSSVRFLTVSQCLFEVLPDLLEVSHGFAEFCSISRNFLAFHHVSLGFLDFRGSFLVPYTQIQHYSMNKLLFIVECPTYQISLGLAQLGFLGGHYDLGTLPMGFGLGYISRSAAYFMVSLAGGVTSVSIFV